MTRSEIGERLREIREGRGILLCRAAVMIGVHRKNLKQYESGEVMPRIDNLPRICKAYNVSPNEIMGWENV